MKKYFLMFVVVLFSLPAIQPLTISGFFPMHDDTQPSRVYEMAKSLKDGQFPVRWVKDLGYGYGYPLFNFYAPLSFYTGGYLHLIGLDALVSTKIMIGVGILLSGIFMFFLAREFWGNTGAIVSALLYVYAPYHALNIYVRGDVAEIWAYAFIPLVFLGFYKIFSVLNRKAGYGLDSSKLQFKVKSELWKWISIGSVGYAGIILSHNLTAMMVSPFLIIVVLLYCYIAYKNKKIFPISYFLFPILLGLLLSAFYWIPALFEMNQTNVLSQVGGGADFRDHFVCLSQLWESPWGFGGSTLGCVDGMSFIIGKIHLLAVFLATILTGVFIFRKKTYYFNDSYHYSATLAAILLSTGGFLIAVLFTLSVSKPIWEALSPMAFFQYPWRFLSLAVFFSSFLGGFAISFLQLQLMKKTYLNGGQIVRIVNLVMAIHIFLLVYFYIKFFQPQTILPKTSSDYTKEEILKWKISKTSDEYLPKNFIKPNNYSEIPNSYLATDLPIKIHKEKTDEILATIYSKEKQKMITSIAYFPFWKVYVNKQEQHYSNEKGRISILLEKGSNDVNIKITQTNIEKISNIISVASFIALLIGIIFKRKLFLR